MISKGFLIIFYRENMRIALILRGHYRSFDITSIELKKAIDGLDCDCYFHTWDLQDSETQTWHRGEKYKLKLYDKHIRTLQSFDQSTQIEQQEFNDTELKNIYLMAPYKTFDYRYIELKDTLKRIPINDYEIVIVSRYDLVINKDCLKNLNIEKNEILIGYAETKVVDNYYKNLRATDLLFAFHPSNIHLFNINPYSKDTVFTKAEEPFTKFIFDNFKKVTLKWKYGIDFSILR